MKRCLYILLALSLLLTCFPVIPLQADAATVASGTCGKAATWSLDDTGVLTISGTGNVSLYDKRKSPWYSYSGQITEIIVDNTITGLSKGIFYGCSKLESITIPFTGNSRKTATDAYQYPFGYIFGSDLFADCRTATQSYWGSSVNTSTSSKYYIPISLKTVTVTDCDIPFGAFQNCADVEHVILGDGVTSIGWRVFENCSSLETVYISDSVTNIDSWAFRNCSGLKSLVVPDAVGVGSGFFEGCGKLESLTIGTLTAPLGSLFGEVSYTGGVATKQYVKSDTNGITEYTYYIPSSLKSVTISQGKIPYGAFYDCTNLTSVGIGKDVTDIGEMAFWNCDSLTDVHITDVAAWCATSIQSSPLTYAENLYLNGNLVTDLVIPEGVEEISDNAFNGYAKLTSVTIPDSITCIGEWAFAYCSSLTYVTIPNSVTDISEGAFAGCTGLKSIDLPNNIEYLSRSVLSSCTGLKSVIIPKNVTNVSKWAFNCCTNLTSILILADTCSIASDVFVECNNLTSVYCAGMEGAYGVGLGPGNDPGVAATWYYETIPCLYIAEDGTEMLRTTVKECITEADSGSIRLLSDTTEDRIILKPGVTLDLNGYTLTADLLVAMDGAMVTDGGENCAGSGTLKVAQENLIFTKDNNGIIPVWNGVDGYVFTKATFQQLAQAAGEGATQYIFLPTFSNTDAAALMTDGGLDNGVKIKVSLTWNDEQCQQFYTYSEDLVQKVFDGTGRWVFSLIITGIAGIDDMTAQAVVVTDTGAQATASDTALVAG